MVQLLIIRITKLPNTLTGPELNSTRQALGLYLRLPKRTITVQPINSYPIHNTMRGTFCNLKELIFLIFNRNSKGKLIIHRHTPSVPHCLSCTKNTTF